MVNLYFVASATLLALAFVIYQSTAIGKAVMSTQETIDAVVAQLGKAKSEIISRIIDLNAQIAAAGVTEKVDTSALSAAAQALDDIVPDAPEVVDTPPPAEVPAEAPAEPPF